MNGKQEVQLQRIRRESIEFLYADSVSVQVNTDPSGARWAEFSFGKQSQRNGVPIIDEHCSVTIPISTAKMLADIINNHTK